MQTSIWPNIVEAANAMSGWEVAAVVLALLYVWLAARQSLWCWPAALLSCCIYFYICLEANLKAEAGLQVFYIVMAVVGWWQWSKGQGTAQEDTGHPLAKSETPPITTLGLPKNLVIIAVNGLGTLGLGYVLANYLSSANPYVDAFTTVFSLYTTWMVTQKILENWLYWIVIDAVSIWLYASRELYLSALLFTVYTVLAAVGYWRWQQHYRTQTLVAA